jgi:hypothetical protein
MRHMQTVVVPRPDRQRLLESCPVLADSLLLEPDSSLREVAVELLLHPRTWSVLLLIFVGVVGLFQLAGVHLSMIFYYGLIAGLIFLGVLLWRNLWRHLVND